MRMSNAGAYRVAVKPGVAAETRCGNSPRTRTAGSDEPDDCFEVSCLSAMRRRLGDVGTGQASLSLAAGICELVSTSVTYGKGWHKGNTG
jgi:hypothetical protein